MTKRKREVDEEEEILLNATELDSIKALITNRSVIALREVHVVETTKQLMKSRAITVNIPNRSVGLQILNGIGTVRKSTSKTSYITLNNNNEIRLVLPLFPRIIKRGAYNAEYLHISTGIDTLLYSFADSIADTASIKITKDNFTIEFKSRHVEKSEGGILFDDDNHLNGLSLEDYWDQLEVKDNVIQRYRQKFSTDIFGHRGIWFD
jgi:hypothetical protein